MLESGEFGIAVLAALTVLLFPDRRSQPLRWRSLLWVFLAASAMFTATLVAGQALAIERHPLRIGPSGAPLAVPVAGGILGPLGWTADGLILVCWAIIMARQVTRYRQSTGNQRQQLKWLIGGAARCVVATAITIFAGNYSSQAAQAVQDAADRARRAAGRDRRGDREVPAVRHRPDLQPDAGLRHRHRAAGRRVPGPGAAGQPGPAVVLAGRGGGLDADRGGAVPPAAPAGAAGGGPAVHRARYDADQIVTAFAARLQDAVDLGTVRDELANVVHTALEPAHLSVWMKEP